MKYGSAPRTSNSGFGEAVLTWTVTASRDTPASLANVLAAAVSPGFATTTSLLVVTSTYQPVRPPASARTASSFSLAVTSVCSLRLTMTGTAPAARTVAAAAESVTATFSVVPSGASHAPPKSAPVCAESLAVTLLAHSPRWRRAVAWSPSIPRSRCMAARICGATPDRMDTTLEADGVVPAIEGSVNATATPAAATTAAATAIRLRCI